MSTSTTNDNESTTTTTTPHQSVFKTTFRSDENNNNNNNNHQHGPGQGSELDNDQPQHIPNLERLLTSQHTLTLQNYDNIIRSNYYNHAVLSPPPLLYGKDKKLLIDVAKAFALRHGYRIVINKNDHRRVILLCSKHGIHKSKSNSSNGHGNGHTSIAAANSTTTNTTNNTTTASGNSDQGQNNGTSLVKNEEEHTESNNTSTNTNTSIATSTAQSYQVKCQCPFRAEIQLKQRRKLWVLKPINMEHNHDDLIQLPVSVDPITGIKPSSSSADSTTTATSKTTTKSKSKTRATITNFCNAENHLDCFWDNGDLRNLMGVDEERDVELAVIDGVKTLNSKELAEDAGLEPQQGQEQESGTTSPTTTNSTTTATTNTANTNTKKNTTKHGQTTTDQNDRKKSRKTAKNKNSNNQDNNNNSEENVAMYYSKQLSNLLSKTKAAPLYQIRIKTVKPDIFMEKFPLFQNHNDEIEFVYETIEDGEQNFYNIQLVLKDSEQEEEEEENGRIFLSEDIIDMSKVINEIVSMELIKKIIEIIDARYEWNQPHAEAMRNIFKTPAEQAEDAAEAAAAAEEDEEEEDGSGIPDLENLTAVAMKAQQHAAKEEQEHIFDPELTK